MLYVAIVESFSYWMLGNGKKLVSNYHYFQFIIKFLHYIYIHLCTIKISILYSHYFNYVHK